MNCFWKVQLGFQQISNLLDEARTGWQNDPFFFRLYIRVKNKLRVDTGVVEVSSLVSVVFTDIVDDSLGLLPSTMLNLPFCLGGCEACTVPLPEFVVDTDRDVLSMLLGFRLAEEVFSSSLGNANLILVPFFSIVSNFDIRVLLFPAKDCGLAV